MFRSNRTGRSFDLYQKPSSGAGVEERIVASDQHKAARELVAGRPIPAGSRPTTRKRTTTSGSCRMLGDRTPAVFLRTLGSEAYATILPGRPLGGPRFQRVGSHAEFTFGSFVPPGSKGPCRGAMAGVDLGGVYARLAA